MQIYLSLLYIYVSYVILSFKFILCGAHGFQDYPKEAWVHNVPLRTGRDRKAIDIHLVGQACKLDTHYRST